jgi:hypothetical protein
MRLNLLASRRLREPATKQAILAALRNPYLTPAQLATTMLNSTVIAVRPREQDHVRDWPPNQLEMLRTAVLTAAEQDRPTFYDWQQDTAITITIRDNGEGVFITFKSPPDV